VESEPPQQQQQKAALQLTAAFVVAAALKIALENGAGCKVDIVASSRLPP
jgi:hypothetical protein